MQKTHQNTPLIELTNLREANIFDNTWVDKDCLGKNESHSYKNANKVVERPCFLYSEGPNFLFRIGIIDSFPKIMQMPLTSLLGLQTLTFCC